jgi:SSS family solute:Na+ symporter
MLDAAVLVAFLAALLVIGRWAAGRVHTSLDYHLCGRRLTKLPVALSLAATEFNGSGLVGGAGLAYTVGVAGSFWNLSAVPAWLLLGFTVAVAFRRLALYTMPELLERRYGPGARRIASLSQLASGILFIGVQILVSELTLSTLLGVPRVPTALLVTAVFVAFTFAGGLLAVVWTDVVCYLVLMAAVVVGFPVALAHAGGWAGLERALPAEQFDLGRLGVAEPLAWVALCLYSYSTDQAYLQRVFASDRPEVARFAYAYTGVNYLLFGGAVALLGMSAAALLPGLGHDDQALPALLKTVFPPGVRSLFLAGILAATISTASSYLSAGSSLFAKDLYEPLLARRGSTPLSEARLLRASRLAVVAIAAVALGIALAAPRIVDAVVLSVLISHAAVFVPLVAALYWPGVGRRAGGWSILAGAAGGLASHFLLYGEVAVVGALHPLFFGPLCSLAVLAALSLCPARRPAEGRERME